MNAFAFTWAPRLLSVLRIVAALIFFAHGTQKILGFLTRPVAFILAGEMAFAYFMGHAPRNFYPVLNGGDASILYCFVFLYISAAGPGPWSVDAAMRGDRGTPATI